MGASPDPRHARSRQSVGLPSSPMSVRSRTARQTRRSGRPTAAFLRRLADRSCSRLLACTGSPAYWATCQRRAHRCRHHPAVPWRLGDQHAVHASLNRESGDSSARRDRASARSDWRRNRPESSPQHHTALCRAGCVIILQTHRPTRAHCIATLPGSCKGINPDRRKQRLN